MPEKTLVMIFQNQSGGSVRISVDNARDGIVDDEVKTAMQLIIDKNIFSTNGGDLAAITGAEIVTRSVQELSVK